MADYNYDESGSMAAYFLLTFLLVVLIPFTFSSYGSLSMLMTFLHIYSSLTFASYRTELEGRVSV